MGFDNFAADELDDFAHLVEDEPQADELRDAMMIFNLPGRQYIGNLDDFRGDGLEGEGHCNMLSADELEMLGWSPLKAIKSVVSAPSKVIAAVTKPVAKVVSKVPIVGKTASGALNFATTMTNPFALANKSTYSQAFNVAKSAAATQASLAKPFQSIVKKVPIVGGLASKAITASTSLNPLSVVTNPAAAWQAQVNAAKAALPIAKTLVKSPVVKTVVGGAAIVFPPIGVPAAAGLAATAAVVAGLESLNPTVRNAAVSVAKNTATLAANGDQGARIALSTMVTQQGSRVATALTTPPPGARRLVFDVHPTGRISAVAG